MNDLLDRGDYSLTEIFDEDDVLQEIKSMNTRLIDLYVLLRGEEGGGGDEEEGGQ